MKRIRGVISVCPSVKWLSVFVCSVIFHFSHSYRLLAEDTVDSLSLSESIAIALEKSPAVDSAEKKVEEAKLAKRIALKDFLPTLTAGYSYLRLDDDPEMSTYKIENISLSPTVSIPVITGREDVQVGTRDNWEAKLTLTQPLFTGFRLIASHSLAEIGADMAKISRLQEELDLILKVKEAYYNILFTKRAAEVAHQAIKQMEAHLRSVRHFFRAGMSTKNHVLEAEVKLAEAMQAGVRAENLVQVAMTEFNILLCRPMDSPSRLEDILSYKPFNMEFDQCLEKALEARPEVLTVLQKVKEAEKQVTLSRSGYYPSIGLRANHYWKGDTWEVNGSDYIEDDTSWDISVSLSWDFWAWGKSYDHVSKNQSQLSRVRNTLVQVEDGIRLEVNRNFLTMKEAAKNIPVARKAVEQAEENYRMNEARYKAQVCTSTDVIDASTLLASSRLTYYNALYGYYLAQAALERAMGREPD
jgi:outer membrane protein TolC